MSVESNTTTEIPIQKPPVQEHLLKVLLPVGGEIITTAITTREFWQQINFDSRPKDGSNQTHS